MTLNICQYCIVPKIFCLSSYNTVLIYMTVIDFVEPKGPRDNCKEENDFGKIQQLSKNEPFSSRQHFLSITQKQCGLITETIDSSSLSEDEGGNTDVKSFSESKEDLLSHIKNLKLDRQQLFFHLVSTLLGFVQNDVMSKEYDSLVDCIEKCFGYLLKQSSNLTWYQHYGLSHVVYTILYELSSSKEGISKVVGSSFYSQYYTTIQIYLQKSSPDSLLLCIDSTRNVFTCLSQTVNATSNTSCHNSDIVKIVAKFTQLGYFDLLKTIYNNIDHLQQDHEFLKNCYHRLEQIFKLVVKVSKQLKNVKGFCSSVVYKGNSQRSHPSRESKHNRKQLSSDEEISQKTAKRLPDSDNSFDDGDNDTAENVSDLDNFIFDGTSDSELETKSKGSIKQKPVEVAAKKGKMKSC